MSKSQKIRDLLKLFPNIKPKKAAKKLEIEYNKSFCNIFYRIKNETTHTPINTNISTKRKKTAISHSPQGGGSITSSSHLFDPDYFSNVNIKTLLMNSAIDDIIRRQNLSKAYDLLSNDQFIERGEVKHNIYWTSDIKPYHRPDFFYPNQHTAIELMHDTHMMYQGGRQKIGKTTAAFNADFEDMLAIPGTVVTLVAPGLEQAEVLLRQGFKETLTLPDGSKFDLWNQLYRPYFLIDNVKKYVMKNGSILQVIPCSEYTTPGYATDILHIEELDKIVKDPQKLRGLGAVLPTIRARREYAKFRITCNNTAGIYRILREDLKDLYPYFVIYMEKPYNPDYEKFTGEHIIYNQGYNCKERPDIDVILKRIMNCVMGESYTKQQLGNIDDYEDEVFNPDKVDLAYKKGKVFRQQEHYDDAVLAIDPGAVHDFAVGIIAKEGLDFYHLWNMSFTISGKTDEEKERMLKIIAKTCAIEYVNADCTHIISESNSGAKLIVPMINHYIRKEIDKRGGASLAEVNEPEWSNWGGDKEQGREETHIYSRAEYITLLQYIFDYGKITLQDRNKYEHKMRVEIFRYKPQDSKEKYKGDSCDMLMHGVWFLGDGREYIERLLGIEQEEEAGFVF
jgi:hypothetical protein